LRPCLSTGGATGTFVAIRGGCSDPAGLCGGAEAGTENSALPVSTRTEGYGLRELARSVATAWCSPIQQVVVELFLALQIRLGVLEVKAGSLKEAIELNAVLEAEEIHHLRVRQLAGSVALERHHLQHRPRQIGSALAHQVIRDILREMDRHVRHGLSFIAPQ